MAGLAMLAFGGFFAWLTADAPARGMAGTLAARVSAHSHDHRHPDVADPATRLWHSTRYGLDEMKIVYWADAAKESWRPGTEALFHASSATGAERLCIGEQWFEPGVGTPLARHAENVEEVISVIAGAAEVTIGDETQVVRAGRAVIVTGGATHRLVAADDERLHIWFALSAAAPVVYQMDDANAVVRMGDGDEPQLARRDG